MILDTTPHGVPVQIFVNSNNIYGVILTQPGSAFPNTPGGRASFSLSQTVSAGTVVSFGVNNGGNVHNDGIGFDATITLAGSTTPAITSGGALSASAFGGFSSVAPGTWVEIYGSNLASTTRSWAGTDFNGANAPTTLSGTAVSIGGRNAFVDYISPGQVNVQIPSDVALGQQPVTVTTSSGTSAPYNITVNSLQPGLLAPPSFGIGGKQYIVALYPDGATYVLPPGAIVSARVEQDPGTPLLCMVSALEM